MTMRWIRRIGAGLLILLAALVLIGTVVFQSGLAGRWFERALIRQIEGRTGARAEIQGLRVYPFLLQVEIDGLTLHGLEPVTAPPLFHALRVTVSVRIVSFFRRKVALDKLLVDRPTVAINIDKNGRSNLPHPRTQTTHGPWRETLFNLRIRRLELRDGSVALNDQRAPLDVRGRNLEFTLLYDSPASGADSYVGSLRWEQVEMAERRDMPFPFDLSAKFTLHRDAFELDQLVLKLPHSELNLRAELASFARPDWTFRYRGRLSLADVRAILRHPSTPDGIADFSGQASYAPEAGVGKEWTANGYYSAHDIRMPYKWFHAAGLATWGNYDVAQRRLVVPNLSVRAFDGTADGRLEMNFDGLAFHTETHLRGATLAGVLAALDNSDFPVRTLHWDARMDVDSVNTWDHAFKHLRTVGETRWSAPQNPTPGVIPAAARVDYDYAADSREVAISQGQITTPRMQLDFAGPLGARDSALEVKFRADDLLEWDDFINAIRGPDEPARRIAGNAAWRGRVLGPITGPTFFGHVLIAQARYDALYWDRVEGNLEYSPDAFQLTSAAVERGRVHAKMNLSLQFDGDWHFSPQNPWTMDASMENAPSSDLQEMFGTAYPVSGYLSGDFHGSGTHAAPVFDAGFIFDNIDAVGYHFDRLSGQLHFAHDDIRFSHAELRKNAGRITGDFSYHPQKQEAAFDLTGAEISLAAIAPLQSPSLPVAGQLEFHVQGKGPLFAPVGKGDFRLVNLKLANEVEGNFSGQVSSDGRNLLASLASSPDASKLKGQISAELRGDEAISGTLSVRQFDLDPLIEAGLHLKQLTAHSSVDGTFAISGLMRRPDSIEVSADITRISFAYEFVQLANTQDIRIVYRRNEVRVEQAHLHGKDTDLEISGSARFDGARPVHFALSGAVNLQLLQGLMPDAETRGSADINMSVEGTMARPRIAGHAGLHDASMHYADFPTGLSKINGDFVFDRSQLVFNRVTAESGGGQLTLSGSVSYGESPVRYQINIGAPQMRIRYPTGMSWLAGGTLQMSGTTEAALVSGKIEVQRLLFAQGVDVASFLASASVTAPGPPSGSPFLRNLNFDVQGQTSPGARIEWAGAHIDMDGDVRLRGTWERPVLLGHIHLLGGEFPFRGNKFELTHGDINFANPFRLDPVLNMEATSTISQYVVTIDFSGPASHLSFNYRSDPPLPDSDVISLLALGSPGEESALRSTGAGAQNYGATALLSEAISSGVGSRIEHLFGISSFRVDPFAAETATESNAAARITIQQQLARDLTVTYSTNAATSSQYQLIQAEYAVKRDLSVVFLRDINGTYGLDIKFVKHFK